MNNTWSNQHGAGTQPAAMQSVNFNTHYAQQFGLRPGVMILNTSNEQQRAALKAYPDHYFVHISFVQMMEIAPMIRLLNIKTQRVTVSRSENHPYFDMPFQNLYDLLEKAEFSDEYIMKYIQGRSRDEIIQKRARETLQIALSQAADWFSFEGKGSPEVFYQWASARRTDYDLWSRWYAACANVGNYKFAMAKQMSAPKIYNDEFLDRVLAPMGAMPASGTVDVTPPRPTVTGSATGQKTTPATASTASSRTLDPAPTQGNPKTPIHTRPDPFPTSGINFDFSDHLIDEFNAATAAASYTAANNAPATNPSNNDKELELFVQGLAAAAQDQDATGQNENDKELELFVQSLAESSSQETALTDQIQFPPVNNVNSSGFGLFCNADVMGSTSNQIQHAPLSNVNTSSYGQLPNVGPTGFTPPPSGNKPRKMSKTGGAAVRTLRSTNYALPDSMARSRYVPPPQGNHGVPGARASERPKKRPRTDTVGSIV